MNLKQKERKKCTNYQNQREHIDFQGKNTFCNTILNSKSSLYDCRSLSLLEFISISSCSCSARCTWYKRNPTEHVMSDPKLKMLEQTNKLLSNERQLKVWYQVVVNSKTTCNLNINP